MAGGKRKEVNPVRCDLRPIAILPDDLKEKLEQAMATLVEVSGRLVDAYIPETRMALADRLGEVHGLLLDIHVALL